MAAVLLTGLVMESDALADDKFPVMTPIVVQMENSATLPELMTKLDSERLVYVGETHTAFADHLLQLEVLRGMASRPEGLALGVEWFQARFQPILDRYLAGEIDEAEMLRQTEYYQRWRFDYRLYRPIIRFAREKGIPIIALNASQELTGEIRRVGINGLSEKLRAELPDSYDVNDKDYEDQLREMFKAHQSDDGMFERFVEVQLTWDETMAQHVADYLKGNPGGRMLVLAGKGHIGGRSGIPNRVTRRTGIEGKSIASFNPASRMFNTADYLVLANEQSLPPAGLMRVMLDTREEGVFVDGFTAGSPAKAAGVEKGDMITAINGEPIRHFVDVKISMIDKQPGTDVEVTLKRDRFLGGDKTETVRFQLAGEAPHHM
jgi:uncharacterized iron-regulated protein